MCRILKYFGLELRNKDLQNEEIERKLICSNGTTASECFALLPAF
jgi:hypothetical protein